MEIINDNRRNQRKWRIERGENQHKISISENRNENISAAMK